MTTSEAKGRFFYKTNRFAWRIDSNRELECSSSRNADAAVWWCMALWLSQYCIETAEQIRLVYGTRFFHLFYTDLGLSRKKLGYFFKPCGTFMVQKTEQSRHDTSAVVGDCQISSNDDCRCFISYLTERLPTCIALLLSSTFEVTLHLEEKKKIECETSRRVTRVGLFAPAKLRLVLWSVCHRFINKNKLYLQMK